ncbi:MAG TPA: sigma-70 family RNA polymerase sigma factor [Gemmatimonadaceae bacterium]
MEPWLSELVAGRQQVAWDLFVGRYRRLMVATITRLVRDHDDVMDVFADVCRALSENDYQRLKRFVDSPRRGAIFSTWLVAVVRNLTIDWIRKRDGRPRKTLPPELLPLQQRIYQTVCVEGRSHVEAYELICAGSTPPISFAEFLREVREVYRFAPRTPIEQPRAMLDLQPDSAVTSNEDDAQTADSARHIARALATLPADVRLAVQLFVVERMSAADVALAVGWPSAKAVYNKVYRALTMTREALERAGITRDDL